MPKLYDRTYGITEDELIKASMENSWTIGDVLSAYTGQVKLVRIFEDLEDNGVINAWATECHCSREEMRNMLIESFDDKANMCIYGHLYNAEVRCTITLKDKVRIHLYLPVSQSYKQLESRVRKLEKLIRL